MVAPANPSAPGIVTTIQTTTSNALGATGGYLASAQAALASDDSQETKQGVAEALENAKVNAIDTTTTAAATMKSALYEPSRTASNAQTAVQPHLEAAKQTASDLVNLINSSAPKTATTSDGTLQDTKAA